MTLLEEIQKEAVDSKSDLGALLRKCKVLAARLGSKQLQDWLIWESNGYPESAEVPDYRVWPLVVKANFSGPYGAKISKATIPSFLIPEQSRNSFLHYPCRESISSLEDALRFKKNSTDTTFAINTQDLHVFLGTNVYEGYNCAQAWAEFDLMNLAELLNSVRNRILDFALELWKEYPMAGNSASQDNTAIESAKVTQIFNMTITGGVATIVGSMERSSVTVNVVARDMESLKKALAESGVNSEDFAELERALKADPQPEEPSKFGAGVASWIGKMVGKAADGSWQIGVAVAGQLLANAITKFYGL